MTIWALVPALLIAALTPLTARAAAWLVRRSDAAWRSSSLEWLSDRKAPDDVSNAAAALTIAGATPASWAACGLVAAASATIAWVLFVQAKSGTELALLFLLVAALNILVFTDVAARILPDVIVAPTAWAGLFFAYETGRPELFDAIVGGAAGAASLAAIAVAYRTLRGRDGLGMGDVKLAGLAGVWCGWQSLPLIMLTAVLMAFCWIAIRAGSVDAGVRRIAFGPFIAAAALCVLAFGDERSALFAISSLR